MTTRKRRMLFGIIIIPALLLVGAGTTYAYMLNQPKTPPQAANVIEAVGNHYVLPTDEEPAILTVVDKGEVSSAFLKGKVEDGDKVLIYQKTQKVIIYRPSLDKIIDAGPAIVDDVEQMAQ